LSSSLSAATGDRLRTSPNDGEEAVHVLAETAQEFISLRGYVQQLEVGSEGICRVAL